MHLWPQDWGAVLLPQAPLAELVVRVSVVYWFLMLFFRFVLRGAGRISLTDVLVIVLIAAAVRHGLTGRHYDLGDALISGFLVIAWDWVLAFLGFNFGFVHRLIRPSPRLLVKDGRIVRANAQREFLTRDAVEAELRLHGIGSIDEVREAYLEPNGRVSVVRRVPG